MADKKKEQKAVLKMLANGKITVDDAHLLLDTLNETEPKIEYEIEFSSLAHPSICLGEIKLNLR